MWILAGPEAVRQHGHVARSKRDDPRSRHLQVVADEPEVEAAFDLDLSALIASIYATVAHDVGKVRNAFDAELGVAEWFGMTTAMIEAGADPSSEALADFSGALVDVARAAGTTEALALLRALSAMTGTPVAEVADSAAAELAAELPDRAWVKTMSRLEPTTALRYGQPDGGQESLVLGFRYGSREHAISVLIDHGLGGGVKDCWLTDKPDVIRQQIAAMADLEPLMEVDPVDWVTAERVLAAALSRPTCAVEPDQLEDVQAYLPLLRRRHALLDGNPWRPSGLVPQPRPARAKHQDTLWDVPAPEPGPPATAGATSTAPARGDRPSAPARRGLVLKVSLDHAHPPIWRRLVVPETITLERLHAVIQAAFGWSDSHLHVFTVGGEEYGPNDGWTESRSERIRLTRLAGVGDTIDYTYDFGDDWRHTIEVEKYLQEPHLTAPRCLAGRRAAPPDDCGGIYGYEQLLATITEPAADVDSLEWAADALGTRVADLSRYDPARFDAAELTRVLGSL